MARATTCMRPRSSRFSLHLMIDTTTRLRHLRPALAPALPIVHKPGRKAQSGAFSIEAETPTRRHRGCAALRLWSVLEEGIEAAWIVRHLGRLGKMHHGRRQVHVGGVPDGRLRPLRNEFDAVRMVERRALHEPGDAPILTMSGCTMRTPAQRSSSMPLICPATDPTDATATNEAIGIQFNCPQKIGVRLPNWLTRADRR